jgi:enamine deaminase RidA (YjgF/YER057c/UK114 family)
MEKEFLNPPELPNWQQAFSQVVVVRAGGVRTIYVAGQVSVDAERKLIGENNLEAQAEQAFGNLVRALTAVDASTADVVKVCIYVKHYQPSDAAIVSRAFGRAFPQDNLPVSTWLGVESLAEEGFLIEVDAVAVLEEL